MNLSEWKKVALGEVVDINSSSLTNSTEPNFEFKYIDLSSVEKGKVFFPDFSIKFIDAPSRARRVFRENDILMSTVRPNLQAFAYVDFSSENYIASTGFAILRASNKVNPKFLYQNLYSQNVSSQINGMLVGSNYPAINNSDVASIIIPLPPLAEQERIAEVLGCWDEGIEKIEKIISLKEQQKKGLMQKLLNPNRNLKMKRFDEIFTDFTKKNTDDGELLSATQEYGVIPRSMLKRHVMSPEGKIVGYKLVEKGNFVISLRSFQGGIEYSEFYGIISPAYTVLKNLLKIDDNFYKYFFKSYLFIEKYISKAIIGIRDGKQISYPDLRSVKIPYPTLEEQSAIANILSTADIEITLLKQKLALFKKQKSGLMQQLLTGKKRLKIEEN